MSPEEENNKAAFRHFIEMGNGRRRLELAGSGH
jgi:hypothetical protein